MKKKIKIRLEVVSLISALVVMVVSAASLLSKEIDAKLLALIFGAIGTGAILSNLIHDLRQNRDDE
jgi:hypothetical protein